MLANATSLPLQVCLSIAASVSLGLKQHVLFLDSTGGFTASRLYQMLQAQAEDEEEQASSMEPPPLVLKLPWLLRADSPRGGSAVVCVPMGSSGSKLFLLRPLCFFLGRLSVTLLCHSWRLCSGSRWPACSTSMKC